MRGIKGFLPIDDPVSINLSYLLVLPSLVHVGSHDLGFAAEREWGREK